MPESDCHDLGRRQFVRRFAVGTVSTIIGAPCLGTFLVTLLAEGTARAAGNDGDIALQLTNFPALQQSFGSVRVCVNPIEGPLPSGNFYPIIVTRGSGNAFYAVSSACTHRGCIVLPYDGSVISCPCHGSEFAMDGSLVNGPAQNNLAAYPILFDGVNTLKITVPGLGYSISQAAFQAGASPRLRLDFPSLDRVDYEVRFRPTAQAAWTVVPFATSAAGALTSVSITGDGTPKSVFVAASAPAGFFSIAVIVREV